MLINNLSTGGDYDNYDSPSESETSDHPDQSDTDEDEVNFVSRRLSTSTSKHSPTSNASDKALHFLVQSLTDEQRSILKKGDCFWCKKPGHFFRDCTTRKAYLANTPSTSSKRDYSRSKGKSSKGKKPQRPIKGKGKFRPRRDINAIINNIIEQFDSSDKEEEDNDDEDF